MLARFARTALVGGCFLFVSSTLVRAQTHVTEIEAVTGPVGGQALPAERIGTILVSSQTGPAIRGAFRFDAGTPFLDDCYDLRWIHVVAGYTENGSTIDADTDGNPEAPVVGELPAIHPQIGQAVPGGLPAGLGDNRPWYYNEQNWSTNAPAGTHVEGVGSDFVFAPGAQAPGAVVTYHTWLVADDLGANELAEQELHVLGGFVWTYTEGAPSSVAWTADLPGGSDAALEVGAALGHASPPFPSPPGASPAGAPWTPLVDAVLRDCSECPTSDANEPDDTCAEAVVVQPGVHGNRSVGFGFDDWLRVEDVPAGFELRVALHHDHARGDIDLFLFDAGDCLTPLRFSISATDVEEVDVHNASGLAVDYLLYVRVSGNTFEVTCNDYLLRIEVVPVGISIYCPGDGSNVPCPCGNDSLVGDGVGCLNSINRGGGLDATGLPVLGADTVKVMGSGMPNGPALYFQGTARVNNGIGVPFGDGLRCVAGAVVRLGVRFNQAGASQVPSAGDPPLSVMGMVMSPGARHYQAWYRDAVPFCMAAPFSLTNAVTVNWRH